MDCGLWTTYCGLWTMDHGHVVGGNKKWCVRVYCIFRGVLKCDHFDSFFIDTDTRLWHIDIKNSSAKNNISRISNGSEGNVLRVYSVWDLSTAIAAYFQASIAAPLIDVKFCLRVRCFSNFCLGAVSNTHKPNTHKPNTQPDSHEKTQTNIKKCNSATTIAQTNENE